MSNLQTLKLSTIVQIRETAINNNNHLLWVHANKEINRRGVYIADAINYAKKGK